MSRPMAGGLRLVLLFAALLLSGCAAPLLLAGAAAGGATVAHDRRSTASQFDDPGIELRLAARITEDSELGKPQNGHISITSYNGVVLLSGEALTTALRDRVVMMANQESGVRKVVDELRVGELSSLGSRTRDTWITTKVKTLLLTDKRVDGLQIKVVTDSGTVYLLGLVTHAESNLATQIVGATEGVQRIVRIFEYLD